MNDDTIGVEEQKVILDEPNLAVASPQEEEKRQADKDFRKETNNKTMKLRVSSPFRDYYEGYVFSLTAESETGPFDILPGHHNFVSLLIPCELILRPNEDGEIRIRISGGIIHIKADEVIVFLDV